mmetsp:Transcript_4838/g.13016  ORF Transcript_4838/g.13016 Transcript_4838/m.13016 type:complete len:271 (-) Transcript_4838:122-934(-)
MVLRAHVAQGEAARISDLGVGLPGVAVVQDGVALARGADAVVAHTRATADGGVVLERRLRHVLANTPSDAAHGLDVRLRRHVVRKLQDPQLVRGLHHARLRQLLPKRAVGLAAGEGHRLEALQLRRLGRLTGVAVRALQDEQRGCREHTRKDLWQLLEVAHLVNFVGPLEPRGGLHRAHPSSVIPVQFRDEKHGVAVGDPDDGLAVRLFDSQHVLKVALLLEVPDCVCVIDADLRTTFQQDNCTLRDLRSRTQAREQLGPIVLVHLHGHL